MKNILEKAGNLKIAKTSITVLKIGLPVILLYLFYIAIYGQIGLATGVLGLRVSIISMIEHVLLGLVLVIAGSLLFDIAERDKNNTNP